jgi:hypothetical protein
MEDADEQPQQKALHPLPLRLWVVFQGFALFVLLTGISGGYGECVDGCAHITSIGIIMSISIGISGWCIACNGQKACTGCFKCATITLMICVSILIFGFAVDGLLTSDHEHSPWILALWLGSMSLGGCAISTKEDVMNKMPSFAGVVSSNSNAAEETVQDSNNNKVYVKNIKIHKVWDFIDVSTYVYYGQQVVNACIPNMKLPVLAMFYLIGFVGLLIPVGHGVLKWSFEKYIYAEALYDFVQGATVGLFEVDLGLLDPAKGGIPNHAKILSIATSFIDLVILKGPSFVSG